MPKRWLSAEEIAAQLGITNGTVYIPCVTLVPGEPVVLPSGRQVVLSTVDGAIYLLPDLTPRQPTTVRKLDED